MKNSQPIEMLNLGKMKIYFIKSQNEVMGLEDGGTKGLDLLMATSGDLGAENTMGLRGYIPCGGNTPNKLKG